MRESFKFVGCVAVLVVGCVISGFAGYVFGYKEGFRDYLDAVRAVEQRLRQELQYREAAVVHAGSMVAVVGKVPQVPVTSDSRTAVVM